MMTMAAGIAGEAFAQDSTGQAGVLFGPHHVFTISAPPGWILDNRSGQADGLVAVFYRQGESWQNGAAVMYVNAILPDSGEGASADRVMSADSAQFAGELPDLKVLAGAPLRTSDGQAATVRRFTSEARSLYEAVAYIPEKRVTPIVVLTAKSRSAFEHATGAFAELVQSYRFLTDSLVVR